jgi:hypothetical protein
MDPFDLRSDRDASGFSRPNRRAEARAYVIRSEMLLILLSTAWLATTLVVVGICRMAARGDALPTSLEDRRPRSEGAVWEDPHELALQDRRRRAAGGRLTTRGVRR